MSLTKLALASFGALFLIGLFVGDSAAPPSNRRSSGSHVAATSISPRTQQQRYQAFRRAFDQLNVSVESRSGTRLFTDSRYLGDGIVEIVATDTWSQGHPSDKADNLETVFQMWKAADGTGHPVMVRVVDHNGMLLMNTAPGHR